VWRFTSSLANFSVEGLRIIAAPSIRHHYLVVGRWNHLLRVLVAMAREGERPLPGRLAHQQRGGRAAEHPSSG
jgi:hypothetical protein